MDPEPPDGLFILEFLLSISFDWTVLLWLIGLIILLICSALVSGSEIAFFSLSPKDLHELHQDKNPVADRLIEVKEKPRKLLATILIANNFVNIAIVIVSDFLLKKLLTDAVLFPMAEGISRWVSFEIPTLISALSFFITVVAVTFILVLFGEVTPKIYASVNNRSFAMFMTGPMVFLNSAFKPISTLMLRGTSGIEKRFESKQNKLTSRQEIDAAIDLTVSKEQNAEEEADILKGIIKFGDLLVKQIMKSRVDVVALDMDTTYGELLNTIKESGFSRIPIYQEDFDNVIGILYVKDLIAYLSENEQYEWQKHIRTNHMYVPESKKIDELLKEFQLKQMHMAIVVDEFGGSAGIITLEDIMEEVIGEIRDEFDVEEDVDYIKIDDDNYIFEGKSMINDVCRIVGEDVEVFETARGESDSLAGLVLENLGYIPKKDKEFILDRFKLKVVSVSKRRIEKIKFTRISHE